MTKVHKGLFTINSGELPFWANMICRWAAYEKIKKEQRQKEIDTQEKIDNMGFWQKLLHGFPVVNYAPNFFMANPFPPPTLLDIERFEKEYPDMAKEWLWG